jgi:hypothetical protein
MKLLAIRLSPQPGKSLVIRRRPESSAFNRLDTGFRRCDETRNPYEREEVFDAINDPSVWFTAYWALSIA